MRSKGMLTIVGCVFASALAAVHAQGQGQGQAAAAFPPCLPQTAPAQAQGGQPQARGPAQPQGERDVTITEIPGIVAAGAKWTKVYQVPGNSADGIVATSDGGVLMAGEDLNQVTKLDQSGKASVFIADTHGAGSLSVDRQGRVYAVQRMLDPRATASPSAPTTAAIVMLLPQRKVIASTFTDGSPLPGRPNDLAADNKGGAFFTQGCVYHASPNGKITLVGVNLRTNGIVLSPDDKTLYVTNGMTIWAASVQADGTLANWHEFSALAAPGADGLAVDSTGRLYVSGGNDIKVISPQGMPLGLIPTPRATISVGFSGPDKKTLYIVANGAQDATGKPITEGPQQTGRTVYTLPMLAQGYKGRAK